MKFSVVTLFIIALIASMSLTKGLRKENIIHALYNLEQDAGRSLLPMPTTTRFNPSIENTTTPIFGGAFAPASPK